MVENCCCCCVWSIFTSLLAWASLFWMAVLLLADVTHRGSLSGFIAPDFQLDETFQKDLGIYFLFRSFTSGNIGHVNGLEKKLENFFLPDLNRKMRTTSGFKWKRINTLLHPPHTHTHFFFHTRTFSVIYFYFLSHPHTQKRRWISLTLLPTIFLDILRKKCKNLFN